MRRTGSVNPKVLLLVIGGGALIAYGLLRTGGGATTIRYASGRVVRAAKAPLPLVATASVARRRGYLTFQPVLADAEGQRITRMGNLAPPRLEIFNDSGTMVHSAKMRYG